jgi:tripartite-type tricarboxylate transporter receptor subunit TctC
MIRVIACLLVSVFSLAASAQDWPARPVRLILPYPPGVAPDIIGRLVSDKLGAMWGRPVIAENRPGAGGIPGMSALVRSAPDGYTYLLAAAAVVVLTPHQFKDPQFNLDTDVRAVATVGTSPMMIAVNPALGVNTLDEFIKLAKSRPGKINFATPGPTGVPNFTGELLSRAAGIELFTVAFNGSTPAVTSTIAGETQLVIDGLPALVSHVKAGKLKAIAVSSAARLPGYEGVPAVAETFKDFQVLGWFNLLAVAKTPDTIVERVNRDVNTIVQMPDIVARFNELGVYPTPGSVKDAEQFMQRERQFWAKLVKEAGIKPQ